MRIAYSSIQFEITRRCNQSCKHCCRGESQNLDLSKEIVDAFIEKNDIYSISSLKFSGGEPTLNGEILKYLVKRLIEKQIRIDSFMLSINGLNYSESFVDGLNELNQYCGKFALRPRERYGTLFVSQSQYHQQASSKVIEKFSKLPYFIAPHGIDIIDPIYLLPYGNVGKNNLSPNKPDLSEIIDYDKSIKIIDFKGETFLFFDYQYISSNGNVLADGCISYDMMDQYYIGNVTEKSIFEMYEEQPKIMKLKR